MKSARACAALGCSAALLASLAGCGSGSGSGASGVASPRRAVRTIPIVPASKVVLPSTAHGCAGAARLPGGGERIPIGITRWRGQVDVLVNACIDKRGPYPFVVDTGASRSVISGDLAHRLGLSTVGPARRLVGAGCSTVGTPVSVANWGVEGFALEPQPLLSTALEHLNGVRIPAGILGSDVWSRFGAVRIDFRRSELEIPGVEAPAQSRTHLIAPAAPTTRPAVPIARRPAIDAPMLVAESPDSALAVVRLRFGAHPVGAFVVDTGAAISVVGEKLASVHRLAPLPVRTAAMTLCSRLVAPEASTGSWSLVLDAGAATVDGELPPQPVAVTALFGQPGLVGALGGDVMSRFGSVVVDYTHARLLLGTG